MTNDSIDWQNHRETLLGKAPALCLPPEFKLPILPTAVQEFGQKSQNSQVSTAQLAAILESDSGLTIEILGLVNSSVFGLRSKVSSVKQALNLLGIQRTKTFVLTTAVKRAMSNCSSRLINLKQFWATNLERALFAREVAELLKADTEMAYATAMLQDFLLPVLTTVLFDRYTDFVDHQNKNQLLLTIFEQKQFQWDHAVAAAQIAQQWDFPDEMICGLYLHHQGISLLMTPEYQQSSIAAVGLSALIPDALQQSPAGLDQLIQLQSVWKSFDLLQMAERTEQAYQAMGGSRVHHISLKRRLEKKLAVMANT